MRRFLLPLAAAILAAGPAFAQEPAMPAPPPADETGYADVNGISLYYEIRGEGGVPLILLHGGVVPGPETFALSFPVLTEGRQVITVDLQGHGRTADIDRPFDHEAMADDIAGLIDHLGLGQADILGLSLGGDVALNLVFRHPELVRKLVIVATAFKRTGWFPDVIAQFDTMGLDPSLAEMTEQGPMADAFPDIDWVNFFEKLGELLRVEYDWTEQVRAIEAPTMLIFADADAISTTHMAEFYALLGGGLRDAGMDGSGRPPHWLAIVPNKTHYDMFNDDVVARLAVPFLDAPMPD